MAGRPDARRCTLMQADARRCTHQRASACITKRSACARAAAARAPTQGHEGHALAPKLAHAGAMRQMRQMRQGEEKRREAAPSKRL
jgi:hypothetical protein